MTKAIFLPKRSDYGMRTTTRYITTHNAAGDGVFGPSPELHALDRNGYEMTRVYGVASVPANLSADVDMDAYTSDDIESNPTSYANTGVTITNGVNFLNVDLGPGAQTVMHRTVTVDFVVVVEGQIELVLDSGERQLLRSGDTVVQRSTMHQWRNASDRLPARFVATVISSVPIEVNGTPIQLQYNLPASE